MPLSQKYRLILKYEWEIPFLGPKVVAIRVAVSFVFHRRGLALPAGMKQA